MPCQIRHYDLDEISEGLPHNPTPPRIVRLQNLICGGPWAGDNNICMLYWKIDASKPDGGFWVAWEDPDPLPGAGVTII